MIRVEQLVYGTFGFTQGFTLVSTSAGITPRLAHDAVVVCTGWGEILSPDFRSALYHVPLLGDLEGAGSLDDSSDPDASRDPDALRDPDASHGLDRPDRPDGSDGPDEGKALVHLVGKAIRQGTDRGDRMAWYHQVLALSHSDYLAAGADCFAFDAAGFFKERWFESDRCTALEVASDVLPRFERESIAATDVPRIREVLAALAEGAEVRLPVGRATRAVRQLQRAVLISLPLRLRARLSLASFAYRPVRRYDFWSLHDQGGVAPATVGEVPVRRERRAPRSAGLAHAGECAADWQLALEAGERLAARDWTGLREVLDRPLEEGKDS
ncbi:MAG: hypothetical protein KAY32_15315 [Candidatus Eisenbacteria sp.]|nr:hypothetical protein [Candidatus Eisenbacteria bacterium]